MRIVLLITLIESALIAVLMVVWRVRRTAPSLIRPTGSYQSKTISLDKNRDARWAFINDWRVEPQADDRRQASGKVGRSSETAPGRRSTTRRRHQAMYKQWSRERHD